MSTKRKHENTKKLQLNKRKKKNGYDKNNNNIEELFDVEKIIDSRFSPHKADEMQFLVKWENYDSSENTWEPFNNLRDNPCLKEFIDYIYENCGLLISSHFSDVKEKLKHTMDQLHRNSTKAEIMPDIASFDSWELQVAKAVFFVHKHETIPELFIKNIEKMICISYFHTQHKVQQKENEKWLKMVHKFDKNVTIENNEDFDFPPQFKYIEKNIFRPCLDPLEKTAIKGCQCTGLCTKESLCCPKLTNNKFAYQKNVKEKTVLRKGIDLIIECNSECSCNADCINRVSQRSSGIKMCLFKTANRGWGVKVMENVVKGKFLIEYCGEILYTEKAIEREDYTYLFDFRNDLNKEKSFTLDSNTEGNLARFFNHSCMPNCQIKAINDCMQLPKNEKICFFAARNIRKGEELTINYNANATEDYTSLKCFCGTEKCRGFVL